MGTEGDSQAQLLLCPPEGRFPQSPSRTGLPATYLFSQTATLGMPALYWQSKEAHPIEEDLVFAVAAEAAVVTRVILKNTSKVAHTRETTVEEAVSVADRYRHRLTGRKTGGAHVRQLPLGVP